MTDNAPTRRFEQAIERALSPGTFVHYRAGHSFVSKLESVAQDLGSLAEEQPQAAAALYETFIAACHEKAQEVDDSGGNLGMFVQQLFVDWIRARQRAKDDAAETVRRLAAWIDDDPYGFCHDLVPHVTKVMNARHLKAFVQLARDRVRQSAPDDGGFAGWPRRQWSDAVKHILAAQGDAEAYFEACQANGLTAGDCNVLAQIEQSRRRMQEALAWVERGLVLVKKDGRASAAEYDLKQRQRDLLCKSGRVAEAVAAAWEDFAKHPGRYTYADLMALAPAEREGWRKRALEHGERAELSAAVDLFVEAGDTERLARRLARASDAELEELSYHWAEPAAEQLRSAHPALAARLYRTLAVQILDAKKSKLYGAALKHLGRARDCYEAAGLEPAWRSLVQELRAAHRRKTSFLPRFERLVARVREPSFMDRTKRRWTR